MSGFDIFPLYVLINHALKRTEVKLIHLRWGDFHIRNNLDNLDLWSKKILRKCYWLLALFTGNIIFVKHLTNFSAHPYPLAWNINQWRW